MGTASSDVSQQDATSVGMAGAGQLKASHYLKEILTYGCQTGGVQMYTMPVGIGACTGSLVQQSAGFTLQGLGWMLLAGN